MARANAMKANSRPPDFNRTAAGIYALAMEQALSATGMLKESQNPECDVRRFHVDGGFGHGCMLYVVSLRRWLKRTSG